MSSNRWLQIPLALLVSLGLGYSIYLISARAIAHWYFSQPPPEGLRQAVAWDPGNAMYYAALARVRQGALAGAEPAEIVQLYEKAAALSPGEARYWAELGGAYELAGRPEDAMRAYERARPLFPHSPEINWHLGNFYLRQGKVNGALDAFQKVLVGNRSLRRPTFDLVWRAGIETDLIFQRLMPPDAEAYLHLLNYLSEKQQMDAAAEAWRRLEAFDRSFDPRAVFFYLDALIRTQRVEELAAAWSGLSQRNPTLLPSTSAESSLVTNSSFESEILNGGLDWRVRSLEGVVVSVDTSTFFDGARSLEVRFYGQQNLDYHHIFQYVLVKPNTLYRFLGYLRAQDITTDSGPRFQVYDAYEPSRLNLSTESLTGTSSWSPQQLQFQTGPDTRLLVIRVVRLPSSRLDNQIAGTFWIDRVSLLPVE